MMLVRQSIIFCYHYTTGIGKAMLVLYGKKDSRHGKECQHPKNKILFEEWEKISSHFMVLYEDFHDNCVDVATKGELEDDIQ